MELNALDWLIVFGLLFFYLVFGLWYSRTKGQTVSEYFLSGRNLPWWMLGVSLVATTFSADTPNLVTDIVRKNGISGNWQWWAFLITGMTTVFIYSSLWRRSNVTTDLELYEIRYGGKSAAFLRGFRAVYLGFFFNVMIMATTTLAAIKMSAVLLGISPIQAVVLAGVITLIYSTLGGLKAVILTDVVQFIVAMIGSVGVSIFVLTMPEIGGLTGLVTSPVLSEKLSFFPDFDDTTSLFSLFIIPLAVQWWSVWYPGSEPGGGGYVAQRILSAKNEKEAIKAVFFFNIAHYALRPWPWVIVALASIIIYPTLDSLKIALPHVDPSIVNDDSAYSAMVRFVPNGLLGLVVASLMAAYMSTISTHLNWGASYLVHDFFKRFVNPQANESQMLLIGKSAVVLLMITQAILALFLESALQAFNILLSVGAGTGLIFMLRWFWWRINAFTEISGMIISFLVSIFFHLVDLPWHDNTKIVMSVAITTLGWLFVTMVTPPTDDLTLRIFIEKINPYGLGWKKMRFKLGLSEKIGTPQFFNQILSVKLGVFGVYFMLFGSGYILFGSLFLGTFLFVLGLVCLVFILRKIKSENALQ